MFVDLVLFRVKEAPAAVVSPSERKRDEKARGSGIISPKKMKFGGPVCGFSFFYLSLRVMGTNSFYLIIFYIFTFHSFYILYFRVSECDLFTSQRKCTLKGRKGERRRRKKGRKKGRIEEGSFADRISMLN